MFDINIVSSEGVTELEKILLDENQELRIVPYEELKGFKQDAISAFCVKYGCYCLPTKELIDCLREEIGNKFAIEIAAGNGLLAKELNITATDSYMQELPEIKQLYESMLQPIVKYGKNVRQMDGLQAIKYFKPQVVLASWCTHIYNPLEAWREGNMYGVSEEKVLKSVKKYIHVGNVHAHKTKPILNIPHREIKEEWLLSRSIHGDQNVIWIWEKE